MGFYVFGNSQEIRFERQLAKQMVQRLSVQVRDNFYDRELRGLNWQELTRMAINRIEEASSPAEMLSAIHGLIGRLSDSHTHFIAPRRTITRQFGFAAMAFGDVVRIHRIDNDGPAARAGLEVGDRLLRINGVNVTRDNLTSVMMSARVYTPVDVMDILYHRENMPAGTVRVFAQITHEPALVYVTGDEEARTNISPRITVSDDLVGYLQLPTFETDNSTLLRSIVSLRNSRSVILDLRGNAGGSVEAAQYLLGFFQQQSSIVAEMIGRGRRNKIEIEPRRPYLSAPLIVLVDSLSGSSAEIVARHLQLSGRALVLGDRTAGRARASRIFWNRLGSKMVITYGVQIAVGRIVFPQTGVIPDRACIPSVEDLRRNEDRCLREALKLPTRLPLVSRIG
jgi:carboxyl-terminal processing protease